MIGPIQTSQDIAFCAQRYPDLICRAIAAQFLSDSKIALLELGCADTEVQVVEERHYLLVPEEDISAEELLTYRRRSGA